MGVGMQYLLSSITNIIAEKVLSELEVVLPKFLDVSVKKQVAESLRDRINSSELISKSSAMELIIAGEKDILIDEFGVAKILSDDVVTFDYLLDKEHKIKSSVKKRLKLAQGQAVLPGFD
jgi:hypothetical protein